MFFLAEVPRNDGGTNRPRLTHSSVFDLLFLLINGTVAVNTTISVSNHHISVEVPMHIDIEGRVWVEPQASQEANHPIFVVSWRCRVVFTFDRSKIPENFIELSLTRLFVAPFLFVCHIMRDKSRVHIQTRMRSSCRNPHTHIHVMDGPGS